MLRLALLILFSAVIPLSTGEFLQCSPSLHTCKAHYTKGYECRVDAKNEGRECVCKNVNSVQTINLIVQCIDCQKHEAWHPLHRECISRKCPAQLHRCYFDIDNIPKCVLSYTMGKCQCSLHQTVKYTAGNILQCADDCRLNMKNNEKTQQCTDDCRLNMKYNEKTQQCTAKICPEDHECTATRGAFYKCHLRNNPSEICSCPHDELVTFSESKQAYVCQICSKEEEWNKETRQCQKRICIAGQHNCPTDSQCFTNDRKQCACAYGYKIEEACNRDGTYICTKTECVDGQYTCSDFNRCSNNNTDPCMCKDDHVTLPDSKHKFLCRASCTSGKEWDPHSGLCINSCYPRYWDGNQCVACDAEHSAWNWYAQACNLCDSDDMEFDGTTCIKRICKNGNHECASTERWGLSCKLRKNHDLLCYCPSNMSPKYSSSAELVCNQVCSNPDKKYYDLVQQRCVACEVGEVLTTSIQKCESLCKGGLARYLDECRQPRVPCPVDNHVCAEQETEKISCHFNDDSMKKCKCPPNMSPKISSSAIMVCKQNCKTDEHWYPQLDACRKLCPDPDKEYFDIDQNKCVSCPAGKVLDRATQQCILLCPVDNHECAKQAGELSCHLIDDRNTKCKCSLDMSPKLSSSAKTVCNKRCQDPDKEYYDLVQQRCVACPAGKILNRALQKCELRCEVSKYFGPCKSPTG